VTVINMRRDPNLSHKTKAFFDFKTKNFLIRGCRLVLAPTGRLIVMLPYREYTHKGKKVFETVIEFMDIDYIESVTAEAIKTYEQLA
jgi:hypothetical protein